MAYQTRCPECRAKLKFDEAPDAEEAIGCPRCGHVFDASEAKPLKKKQKVAAGGGGATDVDTPRKKRKKGESKDSKEYVRKKRRAKKKKSNPVILWAMLAGALVMGPIMVYFMYILFFSTGKMGMLMGYVPGDCNLLRGVDLERFSKIKGLSYADILKNAMDGPFADCRDELAKAAKIDPKDFLDFAMSAKLKDGGKSGQMLVFLTRGEPFDSAAMLKALGGTSQSIDGEQVQKLGNFPDVDGNDGNKRPHALKNAYIYFPAPKQIVVVMDFGDSMRMLKESLKAKGNPKEYSMMSKLGATGSKVCRANVWTLMRQTGDFKDRLKTEWGNRLKDAYPTMATRLNATPMFGTYLYASTYIIYGVALECDSSDTASEFAKSMQEGSLGKGDDSEFHRDLFVMFPVVRTKEFAEFMANLRFKSSDNCAYLTSKMTLEKSMQLLSYYNRPTMWEAVLDADGNPIDTSGGAGGRRR